MSQPIQTPNVGGLLTEFFRLVGTVRPELEEIVMPTILVGDLSGSSPPVARRHASAQGAQVAAAGQNAFFELAMLDPNTIAVVTDIFAFSTAASDQLRVASSGGILTGGATTCTARYTDERVRRSRPSGESFPGFIFRQQSLGGGPIAGNLVQSRFKIPLLASTEPEFHYRPSGLVLRGSTAPSLSGGLTLCNDVVAATLVLGIEWDEYQLP